MEKKISGAILLSEQDFCIAFKRRMKEIKIIVRELREKWSDNWLKKKEEERIRILTEQRDFFKNEAFKLDNLWKNYSKKYKEIKNKCEVITDDRDFLKDQLKKAKKMNKLLYMQNLNFSKKEILSDSSVAGFIEKNRSEFSERSSTDKLMVTKEDIMHEEPIMNQRVGKSFAIALENLKKNSDSMKLVKGKSTFDRRK